MIIRADSTSVFPHTQLFPTQPIQLNFASCRTANPFCTLYPRCSVFALNCSMARTKLRWRRTRVLDNLARSFDQMKVGDQSTNLPKSNSERNRAELTPAMFKNRARRLRMKRKKAEELAAATAAAAAGAAAIDNTTILTDTGTALTPVVGPVGELPAKSIQRRYPLRHRTLTNHDPNSMEEKENENNNITTDTLQPLEHKSQRPQSQKPRRSEKIRQREIKRKMGMAMKKLESMSLENSENVDQPKRESKRSRGKKWAQAQAQAQAQVNVAPTQVGKDDSAGVDSVMM